jgi:hypothetical protein
MLMDGEANRAIDRNVWLLGLRGGHRAGLDLKAVSISAGLPSARRHCR